MVPTLMNLIITISKFVLEWAAHSIIMSLE